MGVTVGIASEHFDLSAFGRSTLADDLTLLDVAVVWERTLPRVRAAAPSRSLVGSLVLLVRLLVGRAPARAPAPRPAFEFRPLPEGFDGASDHGGPHEVLYSGRRRIVRVAGRDHPLPDEDATLVLLVRRDGTAEPVVRRRLLTPAVRIDQPPFRARSGLLARLFGDPWSTDPWRAALMRDPEVAAVLDPRRRRAS